MLPMIKSQLREESDHITVGQFENRPAYANAEGHSLLDSMERMSKQMENMMAEQTTQIQAMMAERDKQRDENWAEERRQTNEMIVNLTTKIDKQNKKIGEQDINISDQRIQLSALVQSSAGHRKMRKRLVEGYKRNTNRPYNGQIIAEGNALAHDGDALADAALFKDEHRSDTYIFRELYGLDPEQVLEFHNRNRHKDGRLFHILNLHASWLADRENPESPNLKAAFDTFLARLRANWPQPPTQDVYWSFIGVHNREKENANA